MNTRRTGLSLLAALLLAATACGAGEDQDTAGEDTGTHGAAVGSSDTVGTAGTMEGAVLPDAGTGATGTTGTGTGTTGGTTSGTVPTP